MKLHTVFGQDLTRARAGFLVDDTVHGIQADAEQPPPHGNHHQLLTVSHVAAVPNSKYVVKIFNTTQNLKCWNQYIISEYNDTILSVYCTLLKATVKIPEKHPTCI